MSWRGRGDVPNPSSQPNFGPNSSYQIYNPISSARLLTDAHHHVKTLTVAVWSMNLHSLGLKESLILLVNTLPTFLEITVLNHFCLLHHTHPNHSLHFVIFRCCRNHHVDQCGQEPPRVTYAASVSARVLRESWNESKMKRERKRLPSNPTIPKNANAVLLVFIQE